MIRFYLWPLFQGQMRIVKIKSAYNSLIHVPRGLRCHANLLEIMGWESFGVVGFDLGLVLQGQMRIAKSKVLINHFFLVLEVCNVKPSYRKSCAKNLLI